MLLVKKKGTVLLYWTFVLPHGRTLNTVSEGFHPDITHLGGNTETEFLYVLLQFIISKIMLLRVTSAISNFHSNLLVLGFKGLFVCVCPLEGFLSLDWLSIPDL